MDVGRARLRAVGEGVKQIGLLGALAAERAKPWWRRLLELRLALAPDASLLTAANWYWL